MTLTHKQQIFVDEYIKSWNATDAARQAGYSPNGQSLRSIGSENLTKPNIKKAIQQQLEESAMSADEVLSRLARIARGNIKSVITVSSANDVEALDDDVSLLIKKFKRKITHSEDETYEDIEIELYSAHEALRDIGKRHALFTDKLDIKVEKELDAILDILEKTLGADEYERVLGVLTATSS